MLIITFIYIKSLTLEIRGGYSYSQIISTKGCSGSLSSNRNNYLFPLLLTQGMCSESSSS